jgi:ATF/CREB family transcription factor
MMSSSASGATITPNTLNAITGVLASGATTNGTNGSQPHPLSVSHLPPSTYEQRPPNYTNGTSTQNSDPRYTNSTTGNATTAANGLFLLSQAHQELTKREEAQRASRSDGDDDSGSNGSGKRSTKRKSYDVSTSPPPNHPKPAPLKRARGMPNGKPKRGDSISVEEDEEEEEEEEAPDSPSDQHTPQMNGKKGGSKKPETEEEKRKNFLERNRQGAHTDFAAVPNPVISRVRLQPLSSAASGKRLGWLSYRQRTSI